MDWITELNDGEKDGRGTTCRGDNGQRPVLTMMPNGSPIRSFVSSDKDALAHRERSAQFGPALGRAGVEHFVRPSPAV